MFIIDKEAEKRLVTIFIWEDNKLRPATDKELDLVQEYWLNQKGSGSTEGILIIDYPQDKL
jgi:hypothetical protein